MFPNPMQLSNLMSQLSRSGNPLVMMQQMFGGNPIFNTAMQISQGKDVNQLQQIVKNLAKERGMDSNQLNSFLEPFGLKL